MRIERGSEQGSSQAPPRAEVHLDILSSISIAAPCGARWEDMAGDEKSRLCARCNLRVHNFAAMTRAEVETLLGGATGRVCARLYRRADGTVLTEDCPVGMARVRRAARHALARGVALVGLFFGAAVLWARGEEFSWNRARPAMLEPFATAYQKINGSAPRTLRPPVMGEICLPPSPATPGATEVEVGP